ncbi:hypothetical protein FRACYDRAFT_242354 [Fragilariopsis cylindrus CCMP1102]|uniref:Dienelactone hydrolase domain-containing protein n=1 Tax=Fragilariopsis cylindrus CCMP1102 TaxID=635003 RepID=A0A1E7F747_9STRA|nr:hypothetical protein FRACYDRAFT_242354 [Fragilariopsis cylindrus CCMP1102]|eukprot:OEU14001.1 hypothetical protein FRACYDRAFT_242354 [Fragilariopsis cylindrus CCMP1102]
MKAVSDGGSSSSDGGRIQRVVVAGAGVIGISTAYYLAKDFGVATTLIDPTGTIAPAASGKAGGFLAKDWNDHSPAIGPLTRRSFELHQEIADKLGADNIQYRRLTCAAIPVGDNTKNRRPPSGLPTVIEQDITQARKQLLQDNGRLLRSRVNASVRALIGFVDNNDNGNKNNIVPALGWCMGAQPILELLTLQQQQDEKAESNKSEDLTTQFSVDALISFHGVFRRDPLLLDEEKSTIITATKNQQRDVLICNGKSDPFVSQNDLEVAKKLMEEKMYKVTVMEFDGAKHGFTNPAQNFNENDAFEYNEYAAKESWKATMELLKRRLL